MAGRNLFVRRVEVCVVCQPCVSPRAGRFVVFIGGSHGRVDKNPFAVYIGFRPPVVAHINIVLRKPVVGRHREAMSVNESGRNVLRTGKCKIDCREALAGGVNTPGNAVCAAQAVFIIVNIVIRIRILIRVRGKSHGVIVKVFRGILIYF